MITSLKEYTERNPLNEIIAENMVDIPMLREGQESFTETARIMFSKAYDICRKMIEDFPAPLWALPDYYRIASYQSGNEDVNKVMTAATLSIVLILTDHLEKNWKVMNKKLLDKMEDYILHTYITSETMKLFGQETLRLPGGQSTCSINNKILFRNTHIDYEIPFEEFVSKKDDNKTEYNTLRRITKDIIEYAEKNRPNPYLEEHALVIPTMGNDEMKKSIERLNARVAELEAELKTCNDKRKILIAENKELKRALEQKVDNPDADSLKKQLEETRAMLEEYEKADSMKFRFILEKGNDMKLTMKERNIIEYVIHSSAIKHFDDNTNANMCRLIGKENTVRSHFNNSKQNKDRPLSKDEKKHIKTILDTFGIEYREILKDHL